MDRPNPRRKILPYWLTLLISVVLSCVLMNLITITFQDEIFGFWSWTTLIGITQFPESTLIALAFIAFFMLVMGILYWIQYNRFTKVAEFAAQAWARRRVLNESIMDAVKRLGS